MDTLQEVQVEAARVDEARQAGANRIPTSYQVREQRNERHFKGFCSTGRVTMINNGSS